MTLPRGMSWLIRYRKLGLPLCLRVEDPDLVELAGDLHRPAIEGQGPCEQDAVADLVWRRNPGLGWDLLLDGANWGPVWPSPRDLYLRSEMLLDDLVRAQLSEVPLLHAGAAVGARGEGVVICGGSGCGKTSLVTRLLLEGWPWLSDEWLCLRDPDSLRVEAWPRSFNLKRRSFCRFPETAGLPGTREFEVPDRRQAVRFFDPRSLGPGGFQPAAVVRLLVFPRYDAGAIVGRMERLRPSDVAGRLAREMVVRHAKAFLAIARLVREVPAWVLVYADTVGVGGLIAAVLEEGGLGQS